MYCRNTALLKATLDLCLGDLPGSGGGHSGGGGGHPTWWIVCQPHDTWFCFPYVLAKFPQESVEDQQYISDLPKAGGCLQCGHVGKLAEQGVSCVDSMLQLSNSSLGRTRG